MTKLSKAVSIYVALLRGVNLAGKNRLPMKDLADLFLGCGACEVKTFIQSGNVVFQATADIASKIQSEVPAQIKRIFGFNTPLILRTAEELQAALDNNPFPGQEDFVHLMLLVSRPEPAAVKVLETQNLSPEKFLVLGQDVYLLLPNGMARTKLNNSFFDRKLNTVSTVRNWRTVTSLVKLATPPE